MLKEIWEAAGELHQLKLRFVDALQLPIRAQASTFGDRRGELPAGVRDLRTALVEWDAALKRFDTATSRLKPHADVLVARGTVLLDRLRAGDALRELADADRVDPERADVPALQALAHVAAGRPADALRSYKRAVGRDPANVLLVYGLARRAGTDGPDETLRAWARVAELLDTVSAPVSQTADRAPFDRVGLLRQAPGVAPLFPLEIYAKGFALLAAGDLAAGVTAFEQALSRDPLTRAASAPPDDAESRRALALELRQQGRLDDAIEKALAAVRVEPSNERAQLLLADLLDQAGRGAEARRALEEAIRVLPGSGHAHYRLGVLLQREARLPEAVDAWRASARIGAVIGQDHLHFLIGSAAVNQADFGGAAAAYGERIAANPNNAEGHRQLAEVFFLQGRDVEALAEHSVAALLSPTSAKAHAGRGQALLRMGLHTQAIGAFERAIALGSDQADLRYALGTALVRVGRADEGRRQLELSQQRRASDIAQGQRDFERLTGAPPAR